jgi:hypothetical protein
MLCARWQAAAETMPDRQTDASYLAFWAAALLRTEHDEQAEEVLTQAEQEARAGRMWCGDLSQLRAAIQRKDRDFIFEPEKSADDDDHWRVPLNCPPPLR